ncbi:hypothetical protein UlMin_032843 [Ulmus minor]
MAQIDNEVAGVARFCSLTFLSIATRIEVQIRPPNLGFLRFAVDHHHHHEGGHDDGGGDDHRDEDDGDGDDRHDEDDDDDDAYDLNDELVPWSLTGKFGRERMRKLGKRGFPKMYNSKRSPRSFVKPGVVRGKHGLGLKHSC